MKKLIVSLVIIVAVVLGGSYLVTNILGLGSSPEALLKKMQKKMTEVDSAKFTGLISVEGEFGKVNLPTGDLTGLMMKSGEEDEEKTENIVETQTGKTVIEISGAIQNKEDNKYLGYIDTKIDYDAEDQIGGLMLSLKMLDGASYLKVSDIDVPVEGESAFLMGVISGAVADKWIKLEKMNLEDSLIPEEEEPSAEDKEKAEKIKELAENTTFLIFDKKVADEKVRNEKTVHLIAKLDKEATKDFLSEAKKISEGVEPSVEELKDLDYFLNQADPLDLHLWIGKSDALLYKAQVEGPIEDIDNGVKVTFSASMEFYDHNKSVTVEEPQSFTTFEELMGQVFGAMMFGAMGDIDMEGLAGEGDVDMENLNMPAGSAFDFEMPDLPPEFLELEASM